VITEGFPDPLDASTSQRRSKLNIMLTVLKAIRGGMYKPTRIMYAANMSWNSTQKVFEMLMEQDLVCVVEEQGKRRAKKRYHKLRRGSTSSSTSRARARCSKSDSSTYFFL